jgi:hypothetical protein
VPFAEQEADLRRLLNTLPIGRPRDAKPEAKAVPGGDFAVSAETLEDARRAALARLAADGRSVRSLSFMTDGGLAAVPPAPAPAQPAKRRRGAP